jgi:8-oxo-dGTP pyrophosphatase MutT (NUDIX family)
MLPKLNPALIDIMRARIMKASNRLSLSKHIPDNLHLADKSYKKAAILVTLCNRHGIPSILLTLRSDNVGTHRGQVSFPGGHINEGENAENAAWRETFEELGDSVGGLETIGECQTVPAITGTLVTPIVGFISSDVGDLTHLKYNTDEVQSVFTRPLDLLNSPSNLTFERLERLGKTFTMPVFGKDDGKERIWGLTALVLHGVLQNLVMPSYEEFYKSNKNFINSNSNIGSSGSKNSNTHSKL